MSFGSYSEAIGILKALRKIKSRVEDRMVIGDCIQVLEEAWADEETQFCEAVIRDSIIPTERNFSVIKGGKSI